jgi:hypothetical protein
VRVRDHGGEKYRGRSALQELSATMHRRQRQSVDTRAKAAKQTPTSPPLAPRQFLENFLRRKVKI